VSKYTNAERALVKSIVGSLTIKRDPESEIIKEVYKQTNKTISRSGIYYVKQQIKRDSFKWYQMLRQGEYEYVHEFKERINEIYFLQKKHYEIIENNANSPSIVQTSLAELHRLNITLSNYFDVAPTIVTNPNPNPKRENEIDNSIPISQQDKDKDIIV
jgi:hypothetical protein